MRWFEGDIVQAVTQSKAQNAVFVVFVEGGNESSEKIIKAIDEAEVSSKLEGPNFIAIRLSSGTQTFNQFSQIYRDPPVPSLYFIGRNGSPIEIVTEVANSKYLLEKILLVESIHFGKPKVTDATASSSVSSTTAVSSGPASSSAGAQSSEGPDPSSSNSTNSAAPLEDRVERAKELLEEKRMKKRIQEEEEARQKELQRRKEGQSVQELRRWQQEQELKQLREERLREKRLEQEARQRVLDQIAQDRANRSARNATSSSVPSASESTSSSTPASNSNEARIQFRLPDGSTHNNRFDAHATLADVRQYIVSNVTLPFQDFALATVFPRYEFSAQDNASTLRELNLVPSSVMLIIPAGGRSVVNSNDQGFFGLAQAILMYITYPVVRIFSYVRHFIFGAPPTSGTSATPPAQNQKHPPQDKRSHKRSGGAYRRAGNSNVHRLHQNNSSSDDENNTWNGNSTQQM